MFSPTERIGIVEEESKDKLCKLEDWFRKELLKRKVFDADDALTAAKYPMRVVAAPSQAHAHVVDAASHACKMEPSPTSSGVVLPTVAHAAAEELTVAHVYKRLSVTGCVEMSWRLSTQNAHQDR